MAKSNFNSWWTRERVRNGLRRFVRDYFDGNEQNLPPRPSNYRFAVPPEDARYAKQMRLYPSYHIVLRYYESMCAAWADLGYKVEDSPREYWTRPRVIAGLKRFYEDFCICPTYQQYIEKSQFSARHGKDGKLSLNGAYGKYPSFLCIRKFFSSMREAWTAAGFDMNKHWEPWSQLEDWFILESVGILPRTEVAEMLKRTVPAVKRRIYDLGRVNSYNRWGITLTQTGTLLGIGDAVIRKYLEYGVIPYFRGHKCIYLNPADLLEVKEIDWTTIENRNPGLSDLIKRALIVRALKILKFRDEWRKHENYKFIKTKEFCAGRIKNPRKSAFADKLPAPPNDLQNGDWVVLSKRLKQVAENRHGRITRIFYSPQKQPRTDGTKRCAWIANVDFPKIKRFTPDGEQRVRYNLPLDILVRTSAPDVEPKPLSTNPEAVRVRKRMKHRAHGNFIEIQKELT